MYVYCTNSYEYVRILLSCCSDTGFPWAVSLGCLHDSVRSQPGSWLVIGMIPVYRQKPALRAGRPRNGPDGCPRRKTMLLHQCYSKILEGWNAITANVKILEWADGVWRRSLIVLGGLLSDQPEADAFCCDGSQTCKVCKCPKAALCDHTRSFPLKNADMVHNVVCGAAKGRFPDSGPKLFDRDHRNPMVWKPTRDCTKARYERVRKAIGGTHIMPNAFWGITLFDVQRQVRIRTYTYVYVRICTNVVRIRT